jgi:hypothetical protein
LKKTTNVFKEKTIHKALKGISPDSPALWFLGTWIIAMLGWLLAPEGVIYIFFPNGRHISLSSCFYLSLCFALFFTGYHMTTRLRKPQRSGFLKLEKLRYPVTVSKVIRVTLKVSYPFLIISVSCTVIHLALCMSSIDFSAFSMNEFSDLRQAYYSSTIQGLTILKWFGLPVFNLYCLGYHICNRLRLNHLKHHLRLLIVISSMVPLMTLVTGSRSIALVYIVC